MDLHYSLLCALGFNQSALDHLDLEETRKEEEDVSLFLLGGEIGQDLHGLPH